MKSTSNIGTTIYDICVGFLQDLKRNNNGGSEDVNEYDYVMKLYFFTSFTAIIIAVALFIISKKYYDGVLDMKDDERTTYYELKKVNNNNNNDDGIDSDKIKRPPKKNYIFIEFFIFILILSWILFFKFGIFKI
jgi:hypothetical protein